MENPINTQPPVQNLQTEINPTTPPAASTSLAKKMRDRIFIALEFIRIKITGISESLGGGTTSVTEISQNTKKVVMLVSALFLTLITLIIVLTYFKNRNKTIPQEEEKGGGVETTIVEKKPSRYATDEAVLKIETDVKTLESDIGKSEIEEKDLTPSSLNFDINFKE